jgi:hypothetical protein
MYPTIRDSPRSATRCGQIEFVASARLLWAWLAWLGVVAGLIAVADLSRLLQCGALLMVGLAGRLILRYVGLRGPDAVQAIRWDEAATEFRVRLGPDSWIRAQPAGCLRYGLGLWLLGFDTPAGRRGLAVDAGLQDPGSFRALIRGLAAVGVRPAGGPAERN